MYGLKHTKTQIAPQITIPQKFFRERTLRPPSLTIKRFPLPTKNPVWNPDAIIPQNVLGEV